MVDPTRWRLVLRNGKVLEVRFGNRVERLSENVVSVWQMEADEEEYAILRALTDLYAMDLFVRHLVAPGELTPEEYAEAKVIESREVRRSRKGRDPKRV